MTELAEVLCRPPAAPTAAGEARGTARVIDGRPHVQIEGAPDPVPCSTTVSVADGDAVTVRYDGHTPVITGNLGSPAVNRQAVAAIVPLVDCIEQTAEGVVVGSKSGGKWAGTRSLLGAAALILLDAQGNPMASFSADGLSLGDCEIRSTGGEMGNLNIYSSAGAVVVTASEQRYPEGSAGTSLRPRPPYIIADDGYAALVAERTLADDSGIIGVGEHEVRVTAEGVFINGSVFVNGKEIL